MINGKVFIAIFRNNSMHICCVCGESVEEMNHKDIGQERPFDHSTFAFNLSTYTWIFFFFIVLVACGVQNGASEVASLWYRPGFNEN
jgi:hypothetical protein